MCAAKMQYNLAVLFKCSIGLIVNDNHTEKVSLFGLSKGCIESRALPRFLVGVWGGVSPVSDLCLTPIAVPADPPEDLSAGSKG